MSNDIASRALIRSMILMDTSLLIVIRFFSWRKYKRFTCRNKLETKFSFLKLFRIVKLLLWKVLLPRHARQKQVSRSIFLLFLVKMSTFQQPATSPQMCLSPVFCRSIYRHAYFGMKCSYRSKSNDIRSRNTEDSVIDKKKDCDKDKHFKCILCH